VVLVGQELGQRADGTFELGQVLVGGSLQDRMSGIKVAVGQVIAHAGDLVPRDAGLSVEQFGGQGLDGLADFQQPDPDRVEDQAVRQPSALQVGADRVDRGLDVGQPLPLPVGSQGHQVMVGPGADPGLEVAGRHQVDLTADNGL
jgi:hypothetical protein